MRSLMLSALAAIGAFGLTLTGSPPANADESPAKIRVMLPPDAALIIDGAPTNSTSDVRDFVTPPLEAGRNFHYDLRARLTRDGNEVTIERRVTVRAGRETVADMNLPGASAPANMAFYYSPESAPTAPPVEARPPVLTEPALPADVGGARNNWKPDSSDPFYPWD